MQQLPRRGGEFRTVEETPFRENPPMALGGHLSHSLLHRALQFRVPPEFQPSVSGWRWGCQGLALSPRPPSGRQLQLGWEGGKRKLSVPGAEDASKGVHGHFSRAQLCLSREREGCGVSHFARLRSPSPAFAPLRLRPPQPPLLALPGSREGRRLLGQVECTGEIPGGVASWFPKAGPSSATAAGPGL